MQTTKRLRAQQDGVKKHSVRYEVINDGPGYAEVFYLKNVDLEKLGITDHPDPRVITLTLEVEEQ